MAGYSRSADHWNLGNLAHCLPIISRYKAARSHLDVRLLGCRQVVRHRFLVPAFAGSNPATPAKAQSDLYRFLCDFWSLCQHQAL